VEGEKMIDIPLFVITGPKTFSGAEEFSYNMQTQKRATLVGQTTGGGANPGRTMQINDSLNVFIPGGMAINPITKTNWEGVGVIPEYKTEPDEALDKAHALAKEAAETYRKETKEKYTKMYMELISHLETYEKGKSEEKILNALSECKTNGILQEWQINMMGYDYLLEHKKAMIAQSIFRANTILFPNSANVFDSYAEALMNNGDLHSAQKNYQIAVDLATKNENPDIELFKKNLKAIQDKIGGNK